MSSVDVTVSMRMGLRYSLLSKCVVRAIWNIRPGLLCFISQLDFATAELTVYYASLSGLQI